MGGVSALRNRSISSARLLSPSASSTQGISRFRSNQRSALRVESLTPMPGPKSSELFPLQQTAPFFIAQQFHLFSGVIAQRLGHHFNESAGKNIVQRSRRRQGHQTRAASHPRAAGQNRRTRFSSGTCHHQNMTVSPFMSVRLPNGNEPTNLFSFQKLDVWRDFLDRAGIDTDVCNGQLTDIAQTRIDNLTELWSIRCGAGGSPGPRSSASPTTA